MSRLFPLIIGALLANWQPVAAQVDLTTLSLEDLMHIEVSLTSRTAERLIDTPAAVYVLTGQDLRRSGATTLPEALRLVPGVEVARIDANKWGVATRGFNGRFANKLLVLIDGRAVYTPFFSGVMWEIKDVLLEDVERIEVIRGPGGTLWGANAVNGIINIITAPAQHTQGGLVKVGGGTEERGLVRLRWGGDLDDNTHFRVYGKASAHDDFVDASGRSGADDWQMGRGGFRLDRNLGTGRSLTWQGDVYRVERGQIYRFPELTPPYIQLVEDDTRLAGGHLQGRWQHTFADSSELRLQVYYDRTEWDDELIGEIRDTYDLDFQHRFNWTERQELVWGIGYRFTTDNFDNSPIFALHPEQRGSPLYSAFVQDRVALNERLKLFLGTKFEHNDFTGIEYQPGARLLWTPHVQHVIWTAITRAVRTPSRADDDVRLLNRVLPPGEFFLDSPPILAINTGDHSFQSERLLAFELGYRLHPRQGLSFDLATFYNDYEDLRTGKLDTLIRRDEPFFHFEVPLPAANLMRGETYGLEVAADWQAQNAGWRLRAAYTYLHMDLRAGLLNSFAAEFEEEASPDHQFFLWSSKELGRNLQWDGVLRFVDRLPTYDIDRYAELDLRLGWKPISALEISIVGRSLLHDSHAEFSDIFVNSVSTQSQRNFYATTTWAF